MKYFYKTLALSVLVSAATMVHAADNNPPPPPPEHNMSMGNMDGMHAMMMNPEHLKKQQEFMLTMHDLSNKILAETDPKKQQALKDQQLELMKAHMMQMMSHKQQMMNMKHNMKHDSANKADTSKAPPPKQ